MLVTCLWFLGLSTGHSIQEDAPQVREEITVRRHVIDVRVIDKWGRPALGLTADDFVLTQKGKRIPLLTCEWVSTDPSDQDTPLGLTGLLPGRLVVVFFQVNLEGSRVYGLKAKTNQAMQVVSKLHPNDRIAIVSFDSHMKLWSDFTTSRKNIAQSIRKALRRERMEYPKRGDFPSLAAHLSQKKGRDSRNPELALFHLGNALASFEETKLLLYLSFGTEDASRGNAQLREHYPIAMKSLIDSRTTVIGMDFTPFEYLTTGLGVRQFAEDTGGYFVKTPGFPQVATRKLGNSLSGYYVLVHETPPELNPDGYFKIKLANGKRGKVLAKSPYNSWGDRLTRRRLANTEAPR